MKLIKILDGISIPLVIKFEGYFHAYFRYEIQPIKIPEMLTIFFGILV